MKKTVIIAALQEELGNIDLLFDIPIIYSGVGKINASSAATQANYLGFEKIINLGSSGSYKHKLGKILKIGKSFQDIDCTPLCPYGVTLFENDSEFIILEEGNEISCFTTDYFYDHNQNDKYSQFYMDKIKNCDFFDMECNAIAKVAKKFKMDFCCFKWVSDGGNSKDWEKNKSYNISDLKNLIEYEFKKEGI